MFLAFTLTAALKPGPSFTLVSTERRLPFTILKGPEGQAAVAYQDGFFVSHAASEGAIPSASDELLHEINSAQMTDRNQKDKQRWGKSGFVIWNTSKAKISFDGNLNLLTPGSDRVLATTKTIANMHPNFVGNPDWGVFTLYSYTEMPDNDEAYSELILPGLKVSKLNFVNTIDWDNHDGWKELGIAQFDDSWGKRSHLLPHIPLICGNPYTGKVLWRSNIYTWGSHFVGNGKYVAAKTLAGTYDLLQANDGKPIRYNVQELKGIFASLGPLIYTTTKDPGLICCYCLNP